MTPLSERVWSSDIESALLSLTRDTIEDRDYHWSTVDRIEEGLSPTTNKQITMTELEVWTTRCKTLPTQTEEAPADAKYPTRVATPQN